jgi:hypothetical protein
MAYFTIDPQRVDALAYADGESFTPEARARSQVLIQEEMRNFTPGDYFAATPFALEVLPPT